ncbi:hypothetical protein GCM10010116_45360 [Microbispora rosea subsp. aerata]|nr:hypothetical protein GCM10010116_45360 [Microbispora rosea subsp. aerata]GIH57433.1 hypothetical protein Mro02_43470 [Microbispora rosea subsp. aerata]GLJ86384.1 hypothetical protein GCM10017588_51210 [Microbispora rosea subsp. aerata]
MPGLPVGVLLAIILSLKPEVLGKIRKGVSSTMKIAKKMHDFISIRAILAAGVIGSSPASNDHGRSS